MNSTVFAPWEDPEKKPLIRFQNVTKKFGTFTAIDNLSLDIYEREFFALLGPSGCGKTTMMRMLAGFETPTSGRIELAGKNIIPVPPNKRATNMMFQSYALFPHLTVWDNIAFGLRREKRPKDQVAARVEEMLKLTRLTKFARRKPHQISGGQRQRAGQEAARRNPVRADGHPGKDRHDLRDRHPRPGRGDDRRVPRGGDGRRQADADRHARPHL